MALKYYDFGKQVIEDFHMTFTSDFFWCPKLSSNMRHTFANDVPSVNILLIGIKYYCIGPSSITIWENEW